MPKAPSAPLRAELPKLYAIVDVDVAQRAGWAPRDLARAYLSGGARLLQLRAKTLDSGPLLALTQAMLEDVREAGGRLIVNDRADIAAIAGAAGVHVGQEDLAPADVRRIVGDPALIGLSTHTGDQIESALAEPIAYLAIGPVFGTATKATGYERVGLDAVRHASARGAAVGLPVVAIGGITLATALQVVEAGAVSLAIISDLLTGDPEARVREYVALLH